MMKTVYIALLLQGMLLAVQAEYQGGNYKIPSTLDSAEAVETVENDIIKGSVDRTLKQIFSVKRISVRPGQLVMRRKIRADTYGFYRGSLDTAAFSMQPPLFAFQLPYWARLEDILKYRLYRSPTDAIGSDEPIVYFDNERLYSRFFSRLYYYRNGVWFPLNGSSVKPVGSVTISSTPPGAEVFIDGCSAGKMTPCIIHDLVGGEYAVEVRLPHHKFFRRRVKIFPDSVVKASFELIRDLDTVFITGEGTYSLLLLPQPPVDKPYIVDDSIRVYSARIRLSPGIHRIKWHADEQYMPLDTLIDIPDGKVLYFDYLFRWRYGIVRIVPTPVDVEICIDKFGCSEGERIEELPAGLYRINAYRHGFLKTKADLHIAADTITTLKLDLRQVPDSDGDGFIDSLDDCPTKYGLYKGCPSPKIKTAVKGIFNEIGAFVASDSLTFGFSIIGMISRNSTNREFRNFLSVFSSGKTGGTNNFRGLTFLNSVMAMYRGLFCSVELGQWSSGLQYQRRDTLFLDSSNIFFFDSIMGVEPRLYIPSTALSFGFHYDRSWFNFTYAIGYQWEDLVFEGIYNLEEQSLRTVTFDNDFWFHMAKLEFDVNKGEVMVPSLYFQFKFPFGTVKRTQWMMFNAGLQLKIFTRPVAEGQ